LVVGGWGGGGWGGGLGGSGDRDPCHTLKLETLRGGREPFGGAVDRTTASSTSPTWEATVSPSSTGRAAVLLAGLSARARPARICLDVDRPHAYVLRWAVQRWRCNVVYRRNLPHAGHASWPAALPVAFGTFIGPRDDMSPRRRSTARPRPFPFDAASRLRAVPPDAPCGSRHRVGSIRWPRVSQRSRRQVGGTHGGELRRWSRRRPCDTRGSTWLPRSRCFRALAAYRRLELTLRCERRPPRSRAPALDLLARAMDSGAVAASLRGYFHLGSHRRGSR